MFFFFTVYVYVNWTIQNSFDCRSAHRWLQFSTRGGRCCWVIDLYSGIGYRFDLILCSVCFSNPVKQVLDNNEDRLHHETRELCVCCINTPTVRVCVCVSYVYMCVLRLFLSKLCQLLYLIWTPWGDIGPVLDRRPPSHLDYGRLLLAPGCQSD